jgi:hypothetical protein
MGDGIIRDIMGMCRGSWVMAPSSYPPYDSEHSSLLCYQLWKIKAYMCVLTSIPNFMKSNHPFSGYYMAENTVLKTANRWQHDLS